MRLFQNSGIYRAYQKRLNQQRSGLRTFREMTDAFLADRYGAPHYLLPILERWPDAFVANGDDLVAQRLWAAEQGMSRRSSPQDILLAQIEHHRTEIFYNTDPGRFDSAFLRRLPGSVRRSIGWHAAPLSGADFGAYDRIVCNFPAILENFRKRGWRADYFFPAHDPALDAYASNTDRPIDVLFVGGYSRHHRRRVAVLEAVAGLQKSRRVEFVLDRSRITRLAESPLGLLPALGGHRRPRVIRSISRDAVFGRSLYALLSQAKIVLNGAIDMAGGDRGNIRCWEALGSAALLVSDAGVYPAGMEDQKTIATYDSPQSAVRTIEHFLDHEDEAGEIASAGYSMLRENYSKARQWQRFQELLG